MKKIFTLFMAGVLNLSLFAADKETARDIFETSKRQMKLDNVSMQLNLITKDNKGNEKNKTISLSFAEFDNQKKILIEFIAPETVAGTKIVTTNYNNKNGIIEIFTPATGRVQKIRANQHNLKIMGSKIPIDQFSSTIEEGALYSFLGDTVYNNVLCYRVKVYNPEKKSYIVALISTDKNHLLKIEKYDTNNKLISVTEMSNYISAGSHSFPGNLLINNLKTGEETIINIDKLRVISDINIDDFKLASTE